MKRIFQMALKDIKIISRDRMGLFFIAGFPILMGVFFGLVMTVNTGSGSGKMNVAVVDEDNSEISQKFVDSLKKNDSLNIEADSIEQAQESVRKGDRVGMIVLPQGFGETAGVFWNEPPQIRLGLDPSRAAESAMLSGFIMQSVGELIGHRFQNPTQFKPFLDQAREQLSSSDGISGVQQTLWDSFFGSMDTMLDSVDQLQQQGGDAPGDDIAAGMQFADIQTIDVTRTIDPDSMLGQLRKIRSRWDISFPQAMMWGVIGCVAGFAISIARERTLGTLLRLQVAPISKSMILAGKAMACFLMTIGVIAFLTAIGTALGMNPASYIKLAVASICIAFCFVGIMMFISVLGRTEQSVAGAGWAIMMIMAMLGGAMIPAMFLPGILQQLSFLSPIRWAIQSIEGAVWREFTWLEMSQPLAILIGFGCASLVAGVMIMRRQDR